MLGPHVINLELSFGEVVVEDTSKTHYLEIAREDIFKYVPIKIFQHPPIHQFKKVVSSQ